MRAVLFSLLLLLVTGDSVVNILITPLDGVLNPPFDSSITNYTIDLTMCNRRPPVSRDNWNCTYNVTVLVAVTNNASAPNATQATVVLYPADIGQPKQVQLTVTDSNGTYDYFVSLILHPNKDAGLLAVDALGGFITPPFPLYNYPWPFLIALNSTGASNTIQVNPTVAPGATYNFTGIPASGAVQVTAECTPIPFTINVLAEDQVTTNSYYFSAYKPRETPLPTEGTIEVELATLILNQTLDQTLVGKHQSDIIGFIAELANIPVEYVALYKSSVLQGVNETVLTVIFLPAACGDPLSTQQFAWRLSASDWADSPLPLGDVNQTVTISRIVNIVNSTQMLYCLNGYNATVYGPQMCSKPEAPAKQALSAEQGVAVATGVLAFIFLVVLVADSIHHKMNKLQEPTNEVELRERTSMKDREPSTSPQSPSVTSAAHEDP